MQFVSILGIKTKKCAHILQFTLSRPQNLLEAWVRVPGGFGDTGFEVQDLRTSGHFWFFTTFLIAVTCSCPSVIDCKLRWFKAFKRKSSNFHLNRKWPEVLKSSTSNAVSLVSPEPPGPRAQAPRGLWGRECSWPSRAILNTVFSWIIAGADYFFFPTKRERLFERRRLFEGGDYFNNCLLEVVP